MGGTRIFLVVKEGTSFFFSGPKGGQRGGPEFFPEGKGEHQNFFYVCKGGDQKKLATGHHKETTFPPGKK